MSSKHKETWSQWDRAWDSGLSTSERHSILKNATTSSFVYTNMQSSVSPGDLDTLVELIENVLEQQQNKLQVKHINWWEQHSQSALQWTMMDKETGKGVIDGWSYANYAEDGSGKLERVSDFY